MEDFQWICFEKTRDPINGVAKIGISVILPIFIHYKNKCRIRLKKLIQSFTL